MTKAHKYLLGICVLALCIMIGACKQQRQPCLTPTTAGLIIESLHKVTDTGTVYYDTGLPAAQFVPITKYLDTIDYPLASLFSISLSPAANSCRWLFRADTIGNDPRNYLYDTLTFYYQIQPDFISNACGYAAFFHLDSMHYSHFNIDSAAIINPSVTNSVQTKHVQIFIKPDF